MRRCNRLAWKAIPPRAARGLLRSWLTWSWLPLLFARLDSARPAGKGSYGLLRSVAVKSKRAGYSHSSGFGFGIEVRGLVPGAELRRR